jgi:hypothetical protein
MAAGDEALGEGGLMRAMGICEGEKPRTTVVRL